MFVVPLKFMCSTQCETPGMPGRSSPEPTRYQHHTDTSGAVCSFLDQNLESVIEARFAHGRQMKHRLRHGHIVHYTGRLAGCRTTPAW